MKGKIGLWRLEKEIKNSQTNDFYSIFSLQTSDRGPSPQANEIYDYAKKYMPDSDPQNLFILPANCLKKPPNFRSETGIARSTNQSNNGSSSNDKSLTPRNSTSLINTLLCGVGGAFEKANKTLDGFRANKPTRNSKSQSHSNRNSLVLVPETSDSNNFYSKRSLTPDLTQPSHQKAQAGTDDFNCDNRMSSSKFPASISSPNLAKQDSSSSTGSSSRYGLGRDNSDLMNRMFNNEEFTKYIEGYERSLERMNDQERFAKGTQTSSSQSSSASGTLKHSGKNSTKKKSLTLPASVISSSPTIKPATIYRYDDRDLVVIDKQDIKESTSNQSDVIIVDPPPLLVTPSPSEEEHVNLSDLLVGNWPETAGGVKDMLNSDKRHTSTSSTNSNNNINSGYRTTERNKSINPISHLVSTTKPKNNVTFDNLNGNDYGSSKKRKFLF